MRQIQVADLTASANEIDTRMGPIPGRSSDRIANELRWAADELQRAMDMLGDVPGTSLSERLQNYIGHYMALQLKTAEVPARTTNEPQQLEVTDEMVTAAMRAFEPMSSVLRYREKDKWHSCDIMGMRDALKAALSLPRPESTR
jgi:hypothetical protein